MREGAVTYPVDDPDKPGNEIIFITGFPTESGRGKIVPAQSPPARRSARRGISDGAVDRPRAGALAHRLDDAALPACSTRSSPRRSRSCRPRTCGG